jgi:putative Holliday junction resolvase
MRVLGVDFGERRIGLAVSDPTGTLATPLPTLTRRRGRRPPLRALEEIGRRHGVGAVVAGLPLDPSGDETDWSLQVREVCAELGRRLGVPVHFVDERMTSAQAERTIRSLGLPKSRREQKDRIDRAAAVIILQKWLDMEAVRRPEVRKP